MCRRKVSPVRFGGCTEEEGRVANYNVIKRIIEVFLFCTTKSVRQRGRCGDRRGRQEVGELQPPGYNHSLRSIAGSTKMRAKESSIYDDVVYSIYLSVSTYVEIK